MSTNSKLGTSIQFEVLDMQGLYGFPQGPDGLVYLHHEMRLVACKYTGESILRDARYTIHTDSTGKGWRIDLNPKIGPVETVYGVEEGRPSYWLTAQAAAAALVKVLDKIEHNSSIGGC